MILFAACAALLSRLTRERDIVVGTVSANRDLPRFKNTVGLFANTIPIRINVSPEDHFHELVGRTRCALLDAHDHCRLPFEEIVKSANPARSNAHLPVVQVMMVFQEGPTPLPRLPGVVATEVTVHTGASKFDLLFELHQSQNGYEGWLEFNADILDVARARRIVEQYALTKPISMRPLGLGSRTNAKTRLSTPRGDFMLKRRPHHRSGETYVEFVHAFHRHLEARTVQVAPLLLNRNGKSAVVVVDAELWEKTQRREMMGSFADFLLASPLRGSGLAVERLEGGIRETSL